MARRCDLCHRGAKSGNNVSHSNMKTKRTFGINLIQKKLDGLRKRICTRCLRTHKKNLAKV
ncbi:MAG: 50S ribosomal protein L28 [bacterium]|nr:50S ribosomal protein L28 [bacterium]